VTEQTGASPDYVNAKEPNTHIVLLASGRVGSIACLKLKIFLSVIVLCIFRFLILFFLPVFHFLYLRYNILSAIY